MKLRMIRPDYLVLGYFYLTVEPESVLNVSQLLLKNGISARIRNGTVILPARLYKDIDQMLPGLEYRKSRILGLYGALLSARHRYGIMLALLVVSALFFFLNSLVWDVRIEGCESGLEDEIIAELESAGLSVGSRWRRIDKGEIEARVLASSDRVSWLNINRRGIVAYVRVIDKVIRQPEEAPKGYANVVASVDCIIENITVKSGVAMVEVGESVRAGQILISGVIPAELGGGYCYAEGYVTGRYTDTVSVSVAEEQREREYTDTSLGAFSVKIFGFSINILKIYGNSQESCDIIEKTKNVMLGGVRLPIRLEYSELHRYTETTRWLTPAELTAQAADGLHLKLLDRLSSAELVSLSTDGEFTDGGYIMRAYAVVRAGVGITKEFELNWSKND